MLQFAHQDLQKSDTGEFNILTNTAFTNKFVELLENHFKGDEDVSVYFDNSAQLFIKRKVAKFILENTFNEVNACLVNAFKALYKPYRVELLLNTATNEVVVTVSHDLMPADVAKYGNVDISKGELDDAAALKAATTAFDAYLKDIPSTKSIFNTVTECLAAMNYQITDNSSEGTK